MAKGRYLEDYIEGEELISRPYRLSKDEIISFAQAYDPQAIHINQELAKNGPFGDIIASGFQTIAIAFRLFVEMGYFHDGVAMGGPGMDEVRWLVPVYPDDIMTNHIKVMEIRKSKSNPNRGILRLGHNLYNQDGKLCTTGVTVTIVASRISQKI